MAAGDLTTLANLKLWAPITSTNTNDDAILSRLISAVSSDFTRATRRPDLLEDTYAEVHQGDGSSRMIAYHWPINSIASLTVGGTAIAESADKIEPGYYLDEDIDPERVWNVYLIGSVFTDGLAVALGYSAGYATVPLDIEQAVIDWCAYRYKNRANVAATQRRSAEGETVQSELIDAPPNVLSVIERYTRELPALDRRAEERDERIMLRGGKPAKGRR
jgi:uncharacterized phiE125 gp8 family phage protein